MTARWSEEQLAIYLHEKNKDTVNMLESDLMWQVRKLAKECGWLGYHTHDSRKSAAGFPDLVLVRRERMLFVELKKETEKPRKEQVVWLDALRRVPSVEVYIWKPSDWISGEIKKLLA